MTATFLLVCVQHSNMLVAMENRNFPALLLVFAIIIMEFSEGLEIQIPQFMQKKYANLFPGHTMEISGLERPPPSLPSEINTYPFQYGANPAGGKSHGGVKTAGVKTGRKTLRVNPTYNYACSAMQFVPMNVKLVCSKYKQTCQATCTSAQYLFPNAEAQLIVYCEYGTWKIQGTDWAAIPACEPVCSPPCQNNGICMAPNQCNCPENYSGPQCQFEDLPCYNYPRMPKNSHRSCNSKQCTITCLNGSEFPDGSAIATMVCKNGLWVPSKDKWVSMPDCEVVCNPPCQNGGKCLSFNFCQCPTEFRGAQCQSNVDACSVKKLPTNGGYNCSGDSESFSCSISCPENVPFEFQPEPVYTCLYSQGIFLPVPIPQCVYPNNLGVQMVSHSSSVPTGQVIPGYSSVNTSSLLPNVVNQQNPFGQGVYKYHSSPIPDLSENNIDVNPFLPHGLNQNIFVTVEQKLPQPGSCFHWGGSHYKTFDGEVYSFESKCSHVLVRDAADDTFSIVTQNHEDCYSNPIYCHTVVTIYLQNKQYFLQRSPEGVPIFGTSKKTLPIPGQVPGIRVEMSAHHIVVLLDAVGASIRWDGQQLVHVEVKESLWNRTEGLCGRLDGDQVNDLLTVDGHRPRSIVTLAQSWKVDDLENICDDLPREEHVCRDTGVKDTLANKATLFCKKLLSDTRFSACQHVVDITSLLDACRWEYCNCKENDRSLCACETLNVYVRDCSFKGIAGLVNWRDANTCPMQCTGGKIYKACGPAKGQPGCGAATEQPEDNEPCVEGCYCPEGTVVHENKCISREKCPCRLRGRSFPAGTSVPKDCNTCTCSDGQWICTEVSCGSRCSAVGDPHYVTFDGKKFDFMGQCSYYLVKNDNFSIEAENVACAGAISQAMNFPASVAGGLPSCTKTVTIKLGGQTIKLKQNHDVAVNGQDISKLPFSIAGINIRSISSIFLEAKLPNGVEILWDGLTRVYIDVPAKYKEKTRGLCGTFNNNQKDDFLTPEDDVEQAVIPFANKWKTDEKCRDLPEVITSHPCDKNMHKKPAAETHCSQIKSELFKSCHWFVDPEQFYQDCMYDMCSCELQVSKCLCPIVASYAYECSRKGVKIDWRGEIRECGIHCPGGQTYQVCGDSCSRTCYDIANDPDCKRQCVEGCNCPEGLTLDDHGECIPIGQCNCQHDGLDFPAGYKEVRPATHGPELCSCVNAVWLCHLASPEEMRDFPRASDLKTKCNASNNLEFTTCQPAEPLTCKNMHSPNFFSASVCHPGCQCKDGHVLDASTQHCVKPTECPCHHGGRSYKENSTVQSDCNTCTCQNGKWKCSDRQCSAECNSWGDSHYKTFDGKYFDYQGQCDYVLAKGNLEPNSFDISIQNVPCGSLGTACSKSVTVKVSVGDDTDSITLSKDKPPPSYKTYKNVIVRSKGVFVILEAPDLGLVVHWDKGTRVYVKVDPRWKNNIKGLCGNYNDNDADDFQTPSGGISEVSANIFGDSWRLQSYCPEAIEIVDTCQERSDRKVWALKKCGILKSPLFAPCHSEVPLNHYYEKCIFDSCACDQGGDCECLCTALAAYAQECNNRGVPIKWRSQQLCPMQCDERCSKYSPCISTCPIETCDNSLINGKLSKTCGEDTCIEGCSPKPCPAGFIYSNSSYLDCIPRNICKPVCLEENGITYYEGELMEEDECHSCYCSREEKICRGLPCTTFNPVEFTTHQMEQLAKCKPGWTAWINQDKEGVTKTSSAKQNDVEPLPSEIVMNNLKESSRCSIDQLVDIECRTAVYHIPAKDTGLDVECSLERGLICNGHPAGLCPDFEIRVLCQCEETLSTTSTPGSLRLPESGSGLPGIALPGGTTTIGISSTEEEIVTRAPYAPQLESEIDLVHPPKPSIKKRPIKKKPLSHKTEKQTTTAAPHAAIPVEPEAARCPPGTVYSPCAIECNRLCNHYLYLVSAKGYCHSGKSCEPGCVSADKKTSCLNGTLWANDQECVSIDECLCVDKEGLPIKPGKVYEQGCRKCQCIDNDLNCYEEGCEIEAVTKQYAPAEALPTVPTMPPVLIPPKTTPPPKCSEDRFLDLIQGDQPLPDDAFNASSILNTPFFNPSNARFDSRSSVTSGGSWAPKYSNDGQYLQIDLGKQEPVYGVIVRGSPIFDEYVTSYRVLYSPDGSTFYYILNKDNYPVNFRGSIDTTTPVKQVFDIPVEAKVIRINPQTWNNAISLRVELIGCAEEVATTTAAPKGAPGQAGQLPLSQFCDDPMGISDGTMDIYQISTSSDLSPEHSKANLKLNGTSSWQPLTNSPTEWIQFDFLEPRNITGLITKGGENGWVTAFTVKHSQNQKDWNPILDDDKKEKVFLGNYDGIMPLVTHFKLSINTRYIKIIPTKWQNNIQMKVEIIGCFKPYPVVEVSTTVSPSACNDCPGVVSPPLEMDACRCLPNLWWDGGNCVNRTSCPCIVDHIPYAVGAHFAQEDCSECTCKLGGVSHCTPKKCEPCREGLKSSVTSTCACTCQACPPDTVLCPTSNICINETLWCNGIQDCTDDEDNCPIPYEIIAVTHAQTTTTKPEVKCPVIHCQPGFKMLERKHSRNFENHLYLSQVMSGRAKLKTAYSALYNPQKTNKKGNKGFSQPILQKPLTVVSELAKEPDVCKEYKCESTKPPPKFVYGLFECPPVVCQPGFISVLEDNQSTESKDCPRYSCYPPMEPDGVCNVTGRTFNTFDDVEYKYDICHHALARDLENNKWMVSLRNNCSTFCSRDLVIWHQNHLFVLHPDLSVEFDGYKYSVAQTKSIGSQNQAFSITQLGNTLLFISTRYGFWIIWNTLGDVKLGVVHHLADKVDGLCGFFNNKPEDDKRKPNGNPARTSVEFGDSWAIAGDQPLECKRQVCPIHTQNKAWEMCSQIKEQPLSACARVLDIEAFVSRCMETTCTCLEHSLDNHTAEEECRCHAMQNFVSDCLSADSTIDLSDWRMQQDCPTNCEPPLVYHDCYQRKCEPTCESISNPSVCPKINNICFPGCYCPPGYVRKGETCIKPSDCRDCECNVLPHLQYVTYDEKNFTVTGICSYVLSRDVLLPEQGKHKFEVLVTNRPCKNKRNKTCVGQITILYEGHTVKILLDKNGHKLYPVVDGKRISDLDEIARWISARETATKHIKLLLTGIQVEVSVYYPSLGVSVKAPSHKYGGKLEGLCGNCNSDFEDDIKTPKGEKPKDVNDFVLSWVSENLPSKQPKQQCQNKPQEVCPQLPVESDPCVQLVDVNKFGQCLNVLDPLLFIEWCKKDTCGGHPELACASIEAYARDCANAGFCINWRNEYCPAKSCPPEQFYDPCGTSSPETCDSIKGLTKAPKKVIPTEGCYCPQGKVFLNNTCVTPNNCEVCDDEGHHPGDQWQKDKCTSCTCEGTSLKCDTQQCPGVSTICESGYKSIKVSTPDNECCDKYACAPEQVAGPTCEPPSQPVCGQGQIMKLSTKQNGCQAFICECKPIEDCDPVNQTTPQEPGYIKELDTTGCCPIANLVCKKELCPKPKNCPEYYSLKVDDIDGKCCPLYSCEPPTDKCIYETEFTAAEKGGERPLTKYEKQNLLKGINETWKDGPCRECKCTIGSLGNNQPVCKETKCAALTTHTDFAEYQLKPELVFDECCPRFKRAACKYDGKIYSVGEKWSIGTDRCTTYECVQTPTGIQRETQVKSCDKNCELGFEYAEPKAESTDCCGSCKQVACVVEGVVHQVDEEWTSADYCTKYFCLNINGSLQMQAVVVNCPKLPDDYLNDFVIETLPVQGDCCPQLLQAACKVGDAIYKIGDTWPSPDGDKCKTVTCIEKENKELAKQESLETCKKECAKGWEYQESNETCCGECVQVACVSEGNIVQPGESWKSSDNCTTYSCDNFDNQFVVSSSQESCPSVFDCPKTNVHFDGCCKRCNLTSAAQKICSTEPVQLDNTIGLINYTTMAHGECINTDPIPNFYECVGNCHSSTFFSKQSGLHESVCSCCQATDYTSISVELVCADGEKWKKKVAVPSKCGCEGCAATKKSYGSVKSSRHV